MTKFYTEHLRWIFKWDVLKLLIIPTFENYNPCPYFLLICFYFHWVSISVHFHIHDSICLWGCFTFVTYHWNLASWAAFKLFLKHLQYAQQIHFYQCFCLKIIVWRSFGDELISVRRIVFIETSISNLIISIKICKWIKQVLMKVLMNSLI